MQVVAQLADRVDPDLVSEGLEHVEVGVRAALDAPWVAEEGAGEPECGRTLAHARRPVEEVCVGGPFGERRVQQPPRLGLLRKAQEACHAPPSQSPERASTRRA